MQQKNDEEALDQAVSVLERKKAELKAQIDSIDFSIRILKPQSLVSEVKGGQLTTSDNETLFPEVLPEPQPYSSDSKTTESKYPEFPDGEGIEEQVIYLIKKHGRLIRRPDLQEQYQIASGAKIGIQHTLNRLRAKGDIVSARFNRSWLHVFYGLSEWLETDTSGKQTFKEAHRPTTKEVRGGYNTIEFDYDKKA